MKISIRRNSVNGWSVLELLLLVLLLLIVAMLLPSGSKKRAVVPRFQCMSNLKQIGTASFMFAADHNGLFPNEVSTNDAGAREFVVAEETHRYFQPLSNELHSPKVLVCPADLRPAVTNFSSLNQSTLSYFVGLDAVSNQPAMFLAGDRNLTRNDVALGAGVFTVISNEFLGWTAQMHKGFGNVGLADGSVEWFSPKYLTENGRCVERQRVSVP